MKEEAVADEPAESEERMKREAREATEAREAREEGRMGEVVVPYLEGMVQEMEVAVLGVDRKDP